jgi:hypothetical protein
VPATGHGQPNQEKNDCSGTHYVRDHGYRASQIARVRPDQADDRSQDDQGDGRGQPVDDPSCGDEAILHPAFLVDGTDVRGQPNSLSIRSLVSQLDLFRVN